MQTIGERLVYVRKNILSMSQKGFSQLFGISQGALSDMENNNRGIPMETLIELIKYSKTNGTFSCEWILTGIEDDITRQISSKTNELTSDKAELLKNYDELDRRGQYKVHNTIYEELDRCLSEKNTERSVG